MRYFTSDLHFLHPFVAATRGVWKRGVDIPDIARNPDTLNDFRHSLPKEEFDALVDTYRHDYAIIKRINDTVGKNDELYILGDLNSGSVAGLAWSGLLLARLNVPPSRCHLVLGNHDGFHIRPTNAEHLAIHFGSISDSLLIDLDGVPAVLSHTPRREYMDGSLMKHAASNSLAKTLRKHAPVVPKDCIHLYGHTHGRTPDEFHDGWSLNVGLDAWNLRPVSETQVLQALEGVRAAIGA